MRTQHATQYLPSFVEAPKLPQLWAHPDPNPSSFSGHRLQILTSDGNLASPQVLSSRSLSPFSADRHAYPLAPHDNRRHPPLSCPQNTALSATHHSKGVAWMSVSTWKKSGKPTKLLVAVRVFVTVSLSRSLSLPPSLPLCLSLSLPASLSLALSIYVSSCRYQSSPLTPTSNLK